MDIKVGSIRHPEYDASYSDWCKWRSAYKGGRRFVDEFTVKFSSRETDADFTARKNITYCPAFAKAAINDIKNSIFQRVTDIARRDGPESYTKAIRGEAGGVDRRGSTMNSYIGREILPDLLVMRKIGVFIDRAADIGETRATAMGKNPYIYKYPVERILSWTTKVDSPSEFVNVLLEDVVEMKHEVTGLVCGSVTRYRHMWISDTDGLVHVQFYNAESQKDGDERVLQLRKIPFVVFEITESLMADVADYQIALLNLGSSDINYALKSNFPFYVEQSDLREQLSHLTGGQMGDEGTSTEANTAKSKEVDVGVVTGRRYPKGNDAPSFINPSSEPLKASMEKQAQLKEEIRLLINLSLTNIKPKMASAESKSLDKEGLESGLSYIGLELEHGERQIAEHWSAYEGTSQVATVNYPEKYDLKSDETRRADAETIAKLITKVPSETLQRSLAQEFARTLVGSKVSHEEFDKIVAEIMAAPAIVSDPEILVRLVETGILSKETAAELLQLPEGEAAKAEEEFRDRTLALAEAQAAKQGPAAVDNPAARGMPDMSADPKGDAKKEKDGKKRRGPGK